MLKMTETAKELFRLLFTKEFHPDKLREALSSGKYSRDDIDSSALAYVYECFDAEIDYGESNRRMGETVPGYETSHLPEAIGILLEHGLDPNRVFDISSNEEYRVEFNIMAELKYVENGYTAADSLALLLEHGGDPCICIGGENLALNVSHDVLFDLREMENRYRYDALVHYWMVLAGYGARWASGKPMADPHEGFDISRLKNHRNYYFGAVYAPQAGHGMEICIFDKRTNCEVARL